MYAARGSLHYLRSVWVDIDGKADSHKVFPPSSYLLHLILSFTRVVSLIADGCPMSARFCDGVSEECSSFVALMQGKGPSMHLCGFLDHVTTSVS